MTPHIKRGNSAAAIPSAPVLGELYFDTGRFALMCFDGASWVEMKSRTTPLAPSLEYPHAVFCHRHEDRDASLGMFDGMPLEPCELWLFDQGLRQNVDFASYYGSPEFHHTELSEYRLVVRFKDPKQAEMFKIVWGGERVKK